MIDYGLGAIFDVPTIEASESEKDLSGLNPAQKAQRLRFLYERSIQSRVEFIKAQVAQNKKRRFNLLLRAETDAEFRHKVRSRCGDDILFRINTFAYTYDPRLESPRVPFLTYPFQNDFILDLVDSIESGIDHWIEKSRDMGFSRLVLVTFVYGFLYRGRASLVGSYKEDYVDEQGNMDSSFERMRYIVSNLPWRMLPEDLEMKYMSISSKILGCQIAGDAGANFGTGGRRKVVFLDEFALRQFASTAMRKTKDLTRCRIFGGTPEGTTNTYGRVMTGHPDYKHLVFKRTRLHRPLHPLKTDIRYFKEKLERTPIDLAQEVDISYQDSVVGAVYPLFRRMVQIGDYGYSSKRKTYTGMDFGLDANACLIIQKDFETNALYLIRAFKRVNWEIRKFAGLVTGRPTQGYSYCETDDEADDFTIMDFTRRVQYAGHFGDPYNSDNGSTVNKKSTIKTELSKLGVHLILPTRKQTVEDRIQKAGLSFNRLYIDRSCVDFFESMIQSRYPSVSEKAQPTAEKTKPVHDENSHYRTAYEYFCACEPVFDDSFMKPVATDYSSQI